MIKAKISDNISGDAQYPSRSRKDVVMLQIRTLKTLNFREPLEFLKPFNLSEIFIDIETLVL